MSASTDANGASFADYDNDGDADVLLVRDGTRSVVGTTTGRGHFTDVSADGGHRRRRPAGMDASWGDFDGDGHLDVYVDQLHAVHRRLEDRGGGRSPRSPTTPTPSTTTTATARSRMSRISSNTTPTTATTAPRSAPASPRRGSTTTATAASICTSPTTSSGRSPDHNRLWRNDGPTPTADGSSPTCRSRPAPRCS